MKLTALEQRAAITIAGIYGLRMFGLFLVMPVLFLYAKELPDFTPSLAGLAVGIYGLTQALLQIPLGYLSDSIGRKKIIVFGLLVFALGSYVAAISDSLFMLIIGRALQGAGAIASTLMAFVSDLSRPEVRSKLMASIGATIGLSFVISLVLGPWLTTYIGVSGLFYVTAILSLVAIAVVIWLVPAEQQHADTSQVMPVKEQLGSVIKNKQLQLMNMGIFFLHLFLTAIFVVLPLQLINNGLSLSEHSLTYLGLMVMSFVLMLPMMIWVEKKRQHPKGVVIAVTILLIAMLGLANNMGLVIILASVGLFFIAFNFLEASIPAMVSRICGTGQRGTAMGFYSTSQFSGAFVGGLLAGIIMQYYSASVLYFILAGCSMLWLFFAVIWLKPLPDVESASH